MANVCTGIVFASKIVDISTDYFGTGDDTIEEDMHMFHPSEAKILPGYGFC